MGQPESEEEALEELAALRADFAIRHALHGFGDIDFDEAMTLIRNLEDESITELDKGKRARIVAAVDNLIEFSVCEEYQAFDEVRENGGDPDFDDADELAVLYGICEKYNKTYAAVENDEIDYSMGIAWWWVHRHRTQIITYMTQRDHRVRPWHAVLDGFTATRDDFPGWMIPPIEWGCRCYLVDYEGDAVGSVGKDVNAKKDIKKPAQIDNVFNESVAQCGRIFGKSHRYFNVRKDDKPMLERIVEKISGKYYATV